MPNTAIIKGFRPPLRSSRSAALRRLRRREPSAPSCGSAKGDHVYIVDADTGSVIKTFDTGPASSPTSSSRTSIATASRLAYAVDTGGEIYRMDFVNSSVAPLASGEMDDSHRRIHHRLGAQVRIRTGAAPNRGKVYLALGSATASIRWQAHYPFTTPVTNRFYVYLDDLAASPANKAAAVKLDDTGFVPATSPPTRLAATSNIRPNSGRKGWFMDLGHGVGEQTVTSASVAGGMVTFSTNRATRRRRNVLVARWAKHAAIS